MLHLPSFDGDVLMDKKWSNIMVGQNKPRMKVGKYQKNLPSNIAPPDSLRQSPAIMKTIIALLILFNNDDDNKSGVII